jgi:hypothetical protein
MYKHSPPLRISGGKRALEAPVEKPKRPKGHTSRKEVSQMSKKLIASCMALAAFTAFAVVPSLASAKPVITHPTSTVLATGTKIKATNVGNATMVTPVGTLTCTSATLTGTLLTNSTAAGIEGEITAAAFGGTGGTAAGEPSPECTGSNFFLPSTSITPNPATNGLPWCIAATAAADTFTVSGGPCGAARAIRFNLAVTNVGTCVYQRAAAVSGTLQTDLTGQDATSTISEQAFTFLEGPGLCPSEGKLNMTFTLETDTATAEPLYFSS